MVFFLVWCWQMYYAKTLVKYIESVQRKTMGKIKIIDSQNIGSNKKLAASKIGSRKIGERKIWQKKNGICNTKRLYN
jgi:hypothetical protein